MHSFRQWTIHRCCCVSIQELHTVGSQCSMMGNRMYIAVQPAARLQLTLLKLSCQLALRVSPSAVRSSTGYCRICKEGQHTL